MPSIFSQIINKQIPAEIIYEDDQIIAFKDKYPRSPGHFLVVPKKEIKNLRDIENNDLCYLMTMARQLAIQETKKLHVDDFNLIVNSGPNAGQEIMHLHIHIVPAKQ